MKTNAKTFNLTQLGVFSALIIIMTFTPIGYLTIPGLGISATLIHLPVIAGAIVMNNIYGGMVLGAVWGVSCIVRAATMGAGLDLLFVNPLVSLVPRVIVGLFAYLSFKLVVKIMKQRKGSEIVGSAVAGLIGTLTNTILVLTALGLLYFEQVFAGSTTVAAIIGTIMSINGAMEIVSAVILVPAICKALFVVKKRMGIK